MMINIPTDELDVICRKYRIRKLSIFGSALRDDFRPESDLDMLVEFEPNAKIGLAFITLQDELSGLFERPVDLNTPDFLSRHFRQKVLDTMQVIYERT